MSAEQSSGRLDPARLALALQFQLQYADLEDFVRGYAVNLSPGGMFIAAHAPPAVGTALRFEVVLADERPILRGEGQVVWTADPAREPQPDPTDSAAALSPEPLSGLGIRFGRLDAKSQALIDRVLAYKAAHPDLFFTRVPDPYSPGPPLAGRGYRPVNEPPAGAASTPAVRTSTPPLPDDDDHDHDDEEAALQALLQPVSPLPLPTATDAARLLDALLDRRT